MDLRACWNRAGEVLFPPFSTPKIFDDLGAWGDRVFVAQEPSLPPSFSNLEPRWTSFLRYRYNDGKRFPFWESAEFRGEIEKVSPPDRARIAVSCLGNHEMRPLYDNPRTIIFLGCKLNISTRIAAQLSHFLGPEDSLINGIRIAYQGTLGLLHLGWMLNRSINVGASLLSGLPFLLLAALAAPFSHDWAMQFLIGAVAFSVMPLVVSCLVYGAWAAMPAVIFSTSALYYGIVFKPVKWVAERLALRDIASSVFP